MPDPALEFLHLLAFHVLFGYLWSPAFEMMAVVQVRAVELLDSQYTKLSILFL